MPPFVSRRRTVVVSTAWCRERTKSIRVIAAGIVKVSKTTVLATFLIVFVLLLQLWQISTLATRAESTVSGRLHPPPTHNSTSSSGSTDHSFSFCQSTRRCQPIHADRDRISYLHISKNSGSSWIQEFKRIKNISIDFVGGPESFPIVGLYPTKHGDHEHSYVYQESLLQDYSSLPDYRRFLTLRSPRHHVWSLFSQCYYSQWGMLETLGTKFPRNHPDHVMMDFSTWLDHFVNTDAMTIRKTRDAYHCYHPANYQSRALSSISAENPHSVVDDIYEPDTTTVNNTYWAMDWVSLTSFFHECKCILYHRIHKGNTGDGGNNNSNNHQSRLLIQEYLEQTCHCRINEEETTKESQSLKDVKDMHYNLSSSSHRPLVADFPTDILQKIDILTRVDHFIYKIALQQFVEEVLWVEAEMKRRILCDTVLEQWEKELNYLDFNLKTEYFALRRARHLDKNVS